MIENESAKICSVIMALILFCIKSSNERDKKGWEMGAENLKMGEIP